jgi:predicted restriction endonuclease
MENNKHLLYYWKEFRADLKAGKVGWLGTKKPGIKIFTKLKDSLASSPDSYVIAFKWEKKSKKVIPLAILKVVDKPVVLVDPKKEYDDYIFYDPRNSYELSEPSDNIKKEKFFKLGSKIINNYEENSLLANFVGVNGLKLISKEEANLLLAELKNFKGNELSIYVDRLSWINQQSLDVKKQEDSHGEHHNENEYDSSLNFRKSENNIEELSATSKRESLPENSKNDNDIPSIQRELESERYELVSQYKVVPGRDIDVLVKLRVGQGAFRKLLIAKHGRRCCISGLENTELLIASHIVPWSKSLPEQQTDSENGLLLSVSWDAVFDKGLITFDDQGNLLHSYHLDADSAKLLGISFEVKLPSELLTERRKLHLAWHRANIFWGESENSGS